MSSKQIETQNWLQLSAVQIGGAVCMPMILIGYSLAKMCPQMAFQAIAVGNILLFILALATSKMSVKTKATTTENASLYFGNIGKHFFAFIIMFSMCAWFAIQSQVMVQDIAQMVQIPPVLTTAILSVLIVIASISGIRSVAKFANVAVPLMIATLLIAVITAFQSDYIAPSQQTGDFGTALSLVIAAAILAVIDLPTFFRHAASKKDAVKASVATFLVGIPLVELAGVLLGMHTESTSLPDALMCLSHPIWKAWICLFVLLAGWTTNNANLYSAAMCLESLVPKVKGKHAIIFAGILCTILSCFDLLENLSMVLELMGVLIASMGAVILSDSLLKKNSFSSVYVNGMAWGFGLMAGLLTLFFEIGFTKIAILDAALVSAVFLIITKRTVIQGIEA